MNTNNFCPVIKRAQQGYAQLREKSFSLSIGDMINGPSLNIQDYAKSFSCHPKIKGLANFTKNWAIDYGIWLKQGMAYITCPLYLFPDAPRHRILPILGNVAVDFFLNDKIGREFFEKLSKKKKRKSAALIHRLSMADPALLLPDDASGLELANMSVLRKLKAASPGHWFSKFLRLYNYHIELAHQSGNIAANDQIPTVKEYADRRNHISGMPHTISFIEFSTGHFINWKRVAYLNLTERLQRLQQLVELFGCLSNDLFSFEKECIDFTTHSNLIINIMQNNPSWELDECLYYAGQIVADLFQEFIQLLGELRLFIKTIRNLHDAESLSIHLDGLERVVKASWAWQVFTDRYKRPKYSIWQENRMAEPVMKAA